MNTNDIRVFLAVFERKSFNSASDCLFMSPQGISKVINRIEEEIGCTLFVRTKQGIAPNSNALYFYKRMRPLLGSYDETLKELNSRNHVQRDKIYFVYTLGMMTYLTVDFIDELHNGFSDVDFVFDEKTDDEVLEMIQSGEADIGIRTGPIVAEGINSAYFNSLRHVVAINDKNPLSKKEKISYADFNDQKVAMLSPHCEPNHHLLKKLEDANAIPSSIYEFNYLDDISHYVSKNNCLAQTIEPFCERYTFDNVVIRPFEDMGFTWDTYFIWSDQRKLTKNQQDFINFSYQWLKKIKAEECGI